MIWRHTNVATENAITTIVAVKYQRTALIMTKTPTTYIEERVDTVIHDLEALDFNSEEARNIVRKVLQESIAMGREMGMKEPHDTEDGYCCACGYDIAVMEEKISRTTTKGEITDVTT